MKKKKRKKQGLDFGSAETKSETALDRWWKAPEPHRLAIINLIEQHAEYVTGRMQELEKMGNVDAKLKGELKIRKITALLGIAALQNKNAGD